MIGNIELDNDLLIEIIICWISIDCENDVRELVSFDMMVDKFEIEF